MHASPLTTSSRAKTFQVPCTIMHVTVQIRPMRYFNHSFNMTCKFDDGWNRSNYRTNRRHSHNLQLLQTHRREVVRNIWDFPLHRLEALKSICFIAHLLICHDWLKRKVKPPKENKNIWRGLSKFD